MKKALITGITGQDGSYLAEFLLNKGYQVFGIVRRMALLDQSQRTARINHILEKVTIIPGDIISYGSVENAIKISDPDECYHLAAQSFVHRSFDQTHETFLNNVKGTRNILKAISKIKPDCKFYFAATSEMFGKVENSDPQNELTRLNPQSPYARSKVISFFDVQKYRAIKGLFACSGILFNHESPRRGSEFVTQKIIRDLKAIKEGKKEVLELGNIHSQRDWGFAGEYVEAMWMILQQEKPDDYVIATGETHTVKEFVNLAAKKIGFDMEWSGEGLEEIAKDKKTGKILVKINPQFYRPADVTFLKGDYKKAKDKFGWEPKVKFEQLVDIMINNER